MEVALTDLDRKIALEKSRRATVPKITAKQIRSVILDTMKRLRNGLNTEDREQVRAVLHRHIEKLVLTPVEKDGRVVFEVSGEFNTNQSFSRPGGGDGKCRKLLVARDGIEPPTPAFSGPRSTN